MADPSQEFVDHMKAAFGDKYYMHLPTYRPGITEQFMGMTSTQIRETLGKEPRR